uniref:protein deglycase n=1 Tax=Phallusia mammillata TaxID=59560 RepID=A0A6F9DNV0_9ASCI|nr:protein DJ-1-like [Phallusia mammillata]
MGDKKAMVLVADGTEEMEAVIVIDVLRRAGVNVTVAGVEGDKPITCSRQVKIVPDADIATALQSGPYDAIVLPGGMQGAKTFAKASVVKDILSEQNQAQRIVGAICAAPIALKAHGLCLGKSLTSYPAVKPELEGYNYSEAKVVKDGNLITSQGPGTAFDFALALVEALFDKEKRDEVAKPMLI